MTKSEEGGGAICISVPHSKFWETWSPVLPVTLRLCTAVDSIDAHGILRFRAYFSFITLIIPGGRRDRRTAYPIRHRCLSSPPGLVRVLPLLLIVDLSAADDCATTAGDYACGIRGRRTENGGSGRLQIGSPATATLPGGMTADAPRRLSQTEALQTIMMASK